MKIKNVINSTLVATVLASSIFTTSVSANEVTVSALPPVVAEKDYVFKDIKGEHYQSDVEWLHSLGIINGYTKTEFMPKEIVTRSQASKMLVATSDVANYPLSKQRNYPNSFTDVTANKWFYEPIVKLYEHNVINGFTEKSFRPDQGMKRSELSKLIASTFDFKVLDTSKESLGEISKGRWFYEPMLALYERGILKHDERGNFYPDNYVNRAEFSQMIASTLTYLESQKGVKGTLEQYPITIVDGMTKKSIGSHVKGTVDVAFYREELDFYEMKEPVFKQENIHMNNGKVILKNVPTGNYYVMITPDLVMHELTRPYGVKTMYNITGKKVKVNGETTQTFVLNRSEPYVNGMDDKETVKKYTKETEEALLEEVNRYRIVNQSMPLRSHPSLEKFADLRKEQIKEFFSHDTREGLSFEENFLTNIEVTNINYVSENLAETKGDILSVLNYWEQSELNKQNMLGNYQYGAVRVVQSEAGTLRAVLVLANEQ